MSPMFSEMAGQNVTNGTFPKNFRSKASLFVGYTVIHVLGDGLVRGRHFRIPGVQVRECGWS